MLNPSMRNAVQPPIAPARSDGADASVTAASVPATAKAAPSPCKARAPITTSPSGATAISSEASANSAMPIVDDMRAPNRSAASPPRTIKTAAASR